MNTDTMVARAMASDIKGVWATILNRIGPDGTSDLGAIGEQVAAYAKAGVDGVYSGGTASEFHCQSEAEFQQIAVLFAQAARDNGLSFQIGAAHPLALGGLDRIAFAAGLKPMAIQVTLPDWTPLDYNSVETFIEGAVDAAAGVPLVLYNPPHAKTLLTPKQLNELSQRFPALIGLKCGGGDAPWYAAMAPVLKRLSVFIPGHFYASGVAHGAHGSYSNMVCLLPSAAVAWAQADTSTARELESRIALFMKDAITPLIERGVPGFVCDKAMASAGGWANVNPRMMWPYEGATAAEITQIVVSAKTHIPEFAINMTTDND